MGKASRDKGKRGEREVAALLREHWPDARRGLQSRGGGAEVADVIGIPGLHVEVKLGSSWTHDAAMRQAEADAAEGSVPVVFARRDRGEWVVLMRPGDFIAAWAGLVGVKP